MGRLWAVVAGSAVACWLVGACGETERPPSKPVGASGEGNVASAGSGNSSGNSSDDGWLVDTFRETRVVKADLLLMIDNSISMADKQALLAEAVPLLVQRIITPQCVRACTPTDGCTPQQELDGIPTGDNAAAGQGCLSGAPEFEPIADVHVGVITSSLGSHGASGAKDVCVVAEDDDHAHLVGQIRQLPETWNETGFLAWDPLAQQSPPGDSDAMAFTTKLRQHVQAAGEHGCGYEGSLEAWYRFLIDPEPPLSVVVTGGRAAKVGVDQVVLDQRAAFLRPDSLLAVIMLSDENDCSLVDEGYGFLAASTEAPLARSTSACRTNPNDACCRSCDAAPAPGCPASATDTECARGAFMAGEDDLNLRCFEQKRRFGMDLLYPTTRYSEALRARTVVRSSDGKRVVSPIFSGGVGLLPRDPGLVYLAAIVGVPWQDLADDASQTGPGLRRYLTTRELTAARRWDVVLGDPDASPPLLPTDPFMVETPNDRTTLAIPQQNPIVPSQVLAPAASTNPQQNAVNGHEHNDLGGRDLQYACTFPLKTPRTCDEASAQSGLGCDCYQDDLPYNRAVCQPPGGGQPTITQHAAKAYPGLRQLKVLKELGDNAIAASICPKVLDPAQPDYGYNPAVQALVNRLKSGFKRRCLPRPLPTDDAGNLACTLVKAFVAPSCDCAALGMRDIASSELDAALVSELGQLGQCTDDTCLSTCRCEVPQLSGAELEDCQSLVDTRDLIGFCYLDGTPGAAQQANPALLADCPADQKRNLRVLGASRPAEAITLLGCMEGDAAAPPPMQD